MNSCKTCQNTFYGNYCNHCGEKKVANSDFTVSSILSQAFGAITNIDSKFLRTFRLLIQNPGNLSRNYVSGIRVPYLKPFQIFLICNILFFIFLADTDLFRTPSKWLFGQNVDFYGGSVMNDVSSIMQSKNMTLDEVKVTYDNISTDLSKSLLVVLIPFIALIGILINRKLPYGKHLIFATHYFSLLLLFTTVCYLITTNLRFPNKWFFIIPVVLFTFLYYTLSIKTFYQKRIAVSIAYAVIATLCTAIFIGFYRNFINLISLKLL
ncbi:MAG: DUF3667 domain-containing protein [Nonlabens sp.]|nr:DUF3667 domain-containing protein [Nonlabens sp.]